MKSKSKKRGKVSAVSKESEQADVLSRALKPAGMANYRNTCWFNAVIQALRAVPQFERSAGVPFAGLVCGAIDRMNTSLESINCQCASASTQHCE
jgi:uncharacterized UBP type Zn finger protein